jgi:uncharacterized membrane protein YsdA (DUF1294 family)/cold shock CspA family protein
MARVQASLVEWLDDKGYGFARQPGGTERIFVHAKALEKGMPHLKKGDELELEIVPGKQGKPAVRNVRVLGARDIARILPYHVITAVMLFILVQLVVITGRGPFGLSVYYVFMAGASLYLYSRDKQAALFGWWRISERTLLSVDLLGGIIGGLLAQHRYRHKQSKQSYQVKIFVIVVFHALLLGVWGSGLVTLTTIAQLLRRLFT